MRPPDIRPKDLRKYAILPFRAVMDQRINRTRAVQVLAVLCSYVDRNGVTFVSQDRLASDLGVSRQAINKQMRILRELGYWVYAKKRSRDQKTQSIKVIYDETITTEEDAFSAQKPEHQMEIMEDKARFDAKRMPNQVKPQRLQVKLLGLQVNQYQVQLFRAQVTPLRLRDMKPLRLHRTRTLT